MIERADQLVLNYVSKAADAAHGVLRADQRLDFSRRLRARIEAERRGSRNARDVAKVLARFGDPVALVEREARRLADAGIPTKRHPSPPGSGAAVTSPSGPEVGGASPAASGAAGTFPSGAGAAGTTARLDDGAPVTFTLPISGAASDAPISGSARSTSASVGSRFSAPSSPAASAGAFGDSSAGEVTLRFPAVADDAGLPPGVREHRRLAQERLSRGRGMPFAGLRRFAMAGANPMATGGRDARTLLKEHPRDAAAMVILVVAALLVPFGLRPLAIFPVPLVVWAAGAAMVLFSESWKLRDKLLGVVAPILGYSVGGVVVGGLRVGVEAGLGEFVAQFFDVSGTMFMVGTGLGVVWLAYRLLDTG
ncbi:hypothetical protein [Nonomuraea aridisoli]|uniref:hypothetical protein n=1 Tax=Nonomuraea aridisoli TaxID=2070368 RepID=UPI000DA81F52|nr:hypothetical protein [Nonomuraea aridisoli]